MERKSETKGNCITIGERLSRMRLEFYERLITSAGPQDSDDDDVITKEGEKKEKNNFLIEEQVTCGSRIKLFEGFSYPAEDEQNCPRPKQWGKTQDFNLIKEEVARKLDLHQKKATSTNESTGRSNTMACRIGKSYLRSFDVVFRSKRDDYKVVKGLIGAVCGLLLGAATYFGLAYAIEFPEKESAIAAAVTTVILCISLVGSTTCRVVVCLCMPTLSLKSGKLLLTTLAAALMLSGPLRTLSMNSTELAIMPSCTADLLYNESIKLQEMAEAPFKAFKPKMQEAIDDLRAQMIDLRRVWEEAKKPFEWIVDLRDIFTFGLTSNVVDPLAFGIVVDDVLKADVIVNPNRREIVANIKEDVERKFALIDEILTYVKRATSLMVLIIVIQSYLYLRRTLNIDNHDNLYITPLFVKVDEQRKKQGKSSLLPLTHSEKQLITDRRHVKMSSVEIKSMIRGLIIASLPVLGAALVVLGDYLLYEGIKYVRRVNEMQLDIEQFTDITVEKENGGRNNTELFSILQDVKHKININVCLPVGTEPDHHQYIGIGVVYIVLLLTVIFQAYLIRLRHFLTLYFYPEIEIERVKALHRILAKQRVITLLSLKHELTEKRRVYKTLVVRETEMSPLIDKLKRLCSCCLRRKKQCFICKRSESKSVKVKKCPSCRQHFCQECMDLVIGTSDCPCLDNTTNPLYNTITDSDFELLDETKGSIEV